MKILLHCALILGSCSLFAQKPKIIKRDTINLSGYIYDSDGSPTKYLAIKSTQDQAEYSNYKFKIGAQTDSNGFFKLNGIKKFDTITLRSNLFYESLQYYNKGSRFVAIYLPPRKVVDITLQGPVQILQTRLHPKKPAIYRPEDFNGCILFTEVYTLPMFGKTYGFDHDSYEKGYAEFADLVKSQVEYPEKAVENNIEGMVQIGFTVERDGSMANFKILKGIGYGCDEEVIRGIKHCPKWRPAINNSRSITINETISVEFKLTDK